MFPNHKMVKSVPLNNSTIFSFLSNSFILHLYIFRGRQTSPIIRVNSEEFEHSQSETNNPSSYDTVPMIAVVASDA